MATQIEALSTRVQNAYQRELVTGSGLVFGFEWVDEPTLAAEFRNENDKLGIDKNISDSLKTFLDMQSQEVSPSLSAHQYRVGGYAATTLGIIYPEYNSPEHKGLVRVSGVLHDIGKYLIEREVMYRSFEVEGYGLWRGRDDKTKIIEHTYLGYEFLKRQTNIPEEAYFAAVLHHQFPPKGLDPYGMKIDDVKDWFKNYPEMAAWIRCVAEVVAGADFFDASSRAKGYFATDEERSIGLIKYFKDRYPDKYKKIIEALEQQKMRYQRKGQVALSA